MRMLRKLVGQATLERMALLRDVLTLGVRIMNQLLEALDDQEDTEGENKI